MIVVALITRHTSKVEHLGVWAPDRGATSFGAGRYVPICQQDYAERPWHITDWPDGSGNGTRRKPLCARCRAVLDDMQELAERRSP